MIHHKKETTSNPKNPRRKPLVDRWKFKDFVEKKKWMEDGLNVSTSLFKSILIPTPYICIFKTWTNIWVILNLNILSVWMLDGQVWPEEDQDPVLIGCLNHKNIIFGLWFILVFVLLLPRLHPSHQMELSVSKNRRHFESYWVCNMNFSHFFVLTP